MKGRHRKETQTQLGSMTFGMNTLQRHHVVQHHLQWKVDTGSASPPHTHVALCNSQGCRISTLQRHARARLRRTNKTCTARTRGLESIVLLLLFSFLFCFFLLTVLALLLLMSL